MKIKRLQVKIFFVATLFFAANTEGFAQQEGCSTLFMYNPLLVNPAAAGARDVPTLVLHHRTQWLGFKGAPTEQSLAFSAPAFGSKRLGFGLTLDNRHIGIFENQTAAMSWSYSPVKTDKFSIRIGLQGSVRRESVRFNDDTEAALYLNDRSIPKDKTVNYRANFGMGGLVTFGESYFGVSVPFFVPTIIGINPYSETTAEQLAHYYVFGGVNLPVTSSITLRPSAMWKGVKNAPWNVEANLNIVFSERVTCGFSYRAGKTNGEVIGESADLILVLQVSDRMAIGGSYDWLLSPVKQYSSGSFEAIIRYDLKKTDVTFSNPRTFF